jgi:cysteine desulfurase/selenocysteine lyase
MTMDISKLKQDFPILKRKINGSDLVYLDNAATSQKPKAVIDAISDYYSNHNANIHRGIHTLSEEATQLYESARKKVADFIGARHPEEIIFTKGTTESINRVAISWALANLHASDEILVTNLEHHSNLVPWQEEARQLGAKLTFVSVDENGELPLAKFKEAITAKTKLVAIAHASNVAGTILPVKEICKLAHAVGAVVCVDGAQAVPHMAVNVFDLGCDFYAFSGHKMLAPTGVGVLYVRKEILDKLEPYEFGGGMIDDVTMEKATWAEAPDKFEAGTPNIEGVIGLGMAIDYLKNIGMAEIRKHEISLNSYALSELEKIPEVKIVGPKDPEKRAGLMAFTVDGIHAHDMASVLNSMGVAVRSGYHCAIPLHKQLNITATTRASYYLYNDTSDVDKLIEGIHKALKLLK